VADIKIDWLNVDRVKTSAEMYEIFRAGDSLANIVSLNIFAIAVPTVANNIGVVGISVVILFEMRVK
jgi:hypothetical protein